MSDDELVIYSAREEEEYRKLLARLDDEAPPVIGRGFDFSKIHGKLENRTRKAIILHLSCTGWSISEIAESLECTTDSVRRFLADAMQEACPIGDVELIRRHELQKLDIQERMFHDGYRRSCEDEETVTETWEAEIETESGVKRVQANEGDPGAIRVVKRVRKGQSGNPAFGNVLQSIAKHRDRLLGLARPQRIEIDKTEKKLVVNVVEVNSREALAASMDTPAITKDS